jgi:hypothetical protein
VADLTTTEIVAVAVIVVLAVVVAGLMLFLIRRLRQRRDKLLGELRDRPELVRDRAFNRLAMARAESEILARQGSDVTRARDLIAQAQGLFDLRDFDRAYQVAQQAHEALVHARQVSPLRRETTPARAENASETRPVPVVGAASPTPSSPISGIPKNRAESQFQLRLLDGDLEGARAVRPRSATFREATRLRTEAGAAFDRGDFTEAFRLALKGRRTLGAPVEGLRAPTGSVGSASSGTAPPVGPDATLTAERVAGADRCPECGYPALSGDTFCRGCGVPRTPAKCGQCGVARKATDTFCGGCGARFA